MTVHLYHHHKPILTYCPICFRNDQFPEESVAMQQRIINRVEGDSHYRNYLNQITKSKGLTATDAITTAACQIAQTTDAKAIVCFTLQGSTVRRASQERPTVPILGITPFKETARQLVMSWGVYPDLPRCECCPLFSRPRIANLPLNQLLIKSQNLDSRIIWIHCGRRKLLQLRESCC